MQNEPWLITAEMRQQCVDTLMRIIEDGQPEDQIEAVRVLVDMVAQNQQSEDSSWLGHPSDN